MKDESVRSKPVKGFEDKYLVYEDGRVFSIPRCHVLNVTVMRSGGEFLKHQPSVAGYPRVIFYKKEGRKFKKVRKFVHILVAEAFLEPKPEGCEVNHKDNNRKNPSISNLEWLTHSENIKHGYANKRKLSQS